jgi:hypothetical protein
MMCTAILLSLLPLTTSARCVALVMQGDPNCKNIIHLLSAQMVPSQREFNRVTRVNRVKLLVACDVAGLPAEHSNAEASLLGTNMADIS